jgi:hypothetical protein
MYDILRFRQTIIPPCHDFTNSPGCHFTITSFRQCAVPPFHHRIIVTIARSHHSTTSIPPINHSANPPFGHSIIPPLVSTSAFHRSAILPHHHFASPAHLIVQKHPNILSFRHLVFLLSLFRHFTIRPFQYPTNFRIRFCQLTIPPIQYCEISLFHRQISSTPFRYFASPSFQHAPIPPCRHPTLHRSIILPIQL